MGGLLDLLQGAVSAGNQAKGAYVDRSIGDTHGLIELMRQELARQRQATMDTANLAHINAETKKLGEPTLHPIIGSDGTVTFYDPSHPQLPPGFKQHVTPDPVTVHAANRDYDVKHPVPQHDQYTFPTGTDENGQPIVLRGNTHTGAIERTPIGRPGANGTGALSPEALRGMADQARHADSVMRRFEEDLRAGKIQLGAGSGVMGGMTSQSGNGLMTSAEKALGNVGLSAVNPRYQEYLAAQRRFGNIMGNLMSRRYTEHQGTLDTDLSGVSANDVQPTISLKQSYRDDLLRALHGRGASSASSAPTTSLAPSGNPFVDLIPTKRP